MGLIDAIFKGALDKLNSRKLKKDDKKAHNKAYKQTGKEIKQAKRQGKTIDGKTQYRINLNKRKKENKENYDSRAKFIDRL